MAYICPFCGVVLSNWDVGAMGPSQLLKTTPKKGQISAAASRQPHSIRLNFKNFSSYFKYFLAFYYTKFNLKYW
jgi:hypothetical protein